MKVMTSWDTCLVIVDGDGNHVAHYSAMDRGWHPKSGAKYWDHEQASLYAFAAGKSNEVTLDSGLVRNPRLICEGLK